MRNKFEFVEDIININLDIVLLSETKFDGSFLLAQFILKEYDVPYRFDRDSKGAGLLFYICEEYLRISSNSDLTVTLNPFVLG